MEKTITLSDFRRSFETLFADLDSGRLARVILTYRGRRHSIFERSTTKRASTDRAVAQIVVTPARETLAA